MSSASSLVKPTRRGRHVVIAAVVSLAVLAASGALATSAHAYASTSCAHEFDGVYPYYQVDSFSPCQITWYHRSAGVSFGYWSSQGDRGCVTGYDSGGTRFNTLCGGGYVALQNSADTVLITRVRLLVYDHFTGLLTFSTSFWRP